MPCQVAILECAEWINLYLGGPPVIAPCDATSRPYPMRKAVKSLEARRRPPG
jgi:hypothetical protein